MQLLIQGLTVFCALAINFLVPLVYGVDVYGEFLKQNISVLVVHKFADIVAEPLIAYIDSKLILFSSLTMSVVVVMTIYATGFYANKSSLGLLIAMLLSSNCMLAMFALRLNRLLVLHLTGVAVVFLILLIVERTNLYNISLVDLMLWTNLIPALYSMIGIVVSGAEIPRVSVLIDAGKLLAYAFPKNISTTLVFNMITNVFPYILAKQLCALDMGMFRVSTSILQAATSLFPINQKALFARLVLGDDRDKKFQFYMAGSLCYFCAIGLVSLLVAKWMPQIKPYVTMISLLPILYWGVLLERYTQAIGAHKMLSLLNMLLGIGLFVAIYFVNNLYEAELAYSVGLGVYVMGLIIVSNIQNERFVYLLVILISFLGFAGGEMNSEILLFVTIVMFVVSIAWIKPTKIAMSTKLSRLF